MSVNMSLRSLPAVVNPAVLGGGGGDEDDDSSMQQLFRLTRTALPIGNFFFLGELKNLRESP